MEGSLSQVFKIMIRLIKYLLLQRNIDVNSRFREQIYLLEVTSMNLVPVKALR